MAGESVAGALLTPPLRLALLLSIHPDPNGHHVFFPTVGSQSLASRGVGGAHVKRIQLGDPRSRVAEQWTSLPVLAGCAQAPQKSQEPR
jgi:hypothetical protein